MGYIGLWLSRTYGEEVSRMNEMDTPVSVRQSKQRCKLHAGTSRQMNRSQSNNERMSMCIEVLPSVFTCTGALSDSICDFADASG